MKNFKKYSDKEIIEAIRSGDERGYKAVFYNRTASLKKYILSNGGDELNADNIEQKTVLILYEKIISGTFKLHPNTKLSTYLYSVGRNLWLKELQKKKKTIHSVDESLIQNRRFSIDDFDDSVREDDEMHEEILVELLNKLDNDCLKILVGKFYENRSDEQISKSLGTISTENIRKRRYKCIQKLKRQFFQRLRQNG